MRRSKASHWAVETLEYDTESLPDDAQGNICRKNAFVSRNLKSKSRSQSVWMYWLIRLMGKQYAPQKQRYQYDALSVRLSHPLSLSLHPLREMNNQLWISFWSLLPRHSPSLSPSCYASDTYFYNGPSVTSIFYIFFSPHFLLSLETFLIFETLFIAMVLLMSLFLAQEGLRYDLPNVCYLNSYFLYFKHIISPLSSPIFYTNPLKYLDFSSSFLENISNLDFKLYVNLSIISLVLFEMTHASHFRHALLTPCLS